jgi:hypothetical protein
MGRRERENDKKNKFKREKDKKLNIETKAV